MYYIKDLDKSTEKCSYYYCCRDTFYEAHQVFLELIKKGYNVTISYRPKGV